MVGPSLRDLLIAGVVLASGLAVGVFLVPGGAETALMRLRDGRLDEAERAFAQAWRAGDRSATMITAYCDVLMSRGRDAEAIEVLEDYVAGKPADMGARRTLADYRLGALRLAERDEDLLVLTQTAPNEAIDRELADRHRLNGDDDALIDDLRRLLSLRPADAAIANEAGRLSTALNRGHEAIEILAKADDQGATGVDRALLLTLMLENGRRGPARERAARALAGDPSTPTVEAIVGVFRDAGDADGALELLRPTMARAETDDDYALTLIEVLLVGGHGEEARERLARRVAGRPIAEARLVRFLWAAFGAGIPGVAIDALGDRPMSAVPDELLLQTADAARALGRRDLLERMRRELPEERLADRPTLAADLATSRGDREEAARWVRRGLNDTRSPVEDRLEAARRLFDLGRREEVAAWLKSLPPDVDLTDDATAKIAGLRVDGETVTEGLAWFAARKNVRPGLGTDRAWARLAILAGAPGAESAAGAVIAGDPPPDIDTLRDMTDAAITAGLIDLASRAADRALAVAPGPVAIGLKARALIAAGRATEALPLLDDMARADPVMADAARVAVLSALGRKSEVAAIWAAAAGEGTEARERRLRLVRSLVDLRAFAAALPVLRDLAAREGGDWLHLTAETSRRAKAVPDLVAFLEKELARGDLTVAQRTDRLWLLIDNAGFEGALPALRTLSRAESVDDWEAVYRDALRQTGKRDELRRRLAEAATDKRRSVEKRRADAFALLEEGGRVEAERAFRDLAENAEPGDPSLDELLHLWGPRPTPDAMRWLEKRSRSATEPNRAAAWRALIAERSGAARPTANAAETDAELEAGLKIARVAAKGADRAAEERAWEAVLARRPDNWEAVEALSRSAFKRNDWAKVDAALAPYLARKPDDVDLNLRDAEALAALGRKDEAAERWKAVIKALRGAPGPLDVERSLTLATALGRIGDADGAVNLFESLRRDHPRDREIRAEYAQYLLDIGRNREARDVLEAK